MGVDIPVAGVDSILKSQVEWEKNCIKRSTKEKLHKRNLQRRAKKERHEWEKGYMEALQSAGSAVGEYVGDGQGESDHVAQAVVVDADLVVDVQLEDENEDSIDDADPLLFLYDCETTGLSIYNDHIIEIAAVLINCPVPYNNTSFSSLVKTSRRIPTPGEIAVSERG